jgi:membrane-associated phospholipid phosphatase
LPFDDYIVWHSPGFLSFTVPYDRTRDFFFSGHTSSLSIVMLEMFYLGWYWVGAFTFLNLIFMMNMLIITRVHYTIDVMAGLIFAITSFRLTILILKYEDYLLSIPFYIGRKIYRKLRKDDIDKDY